MTYFNESRRTFLKTLSTTTSLLATPLTIQTKTKYPPTDEKLDATENTSKEGVETHDTELNFYDGPDSPLFKPIKISGNKTIGEMANSDFTKEFLNAIPYAPSGPGIAWGIPFTIPKRIILLKDKSFSVKVSPFEAKWVIFLHTSNTAIRNQDNDKKDNDFFNKEERFHLHIADYIISYADGSETKLPIHQFFQIGMIQHVWGANCIEAVAHHKPIPRCPDYEQMAKDQEHNRDQFDITDQGRFNMYPAGKRHFIHQTRVDSADRGYWINWLWAWENPYPEKKIVGFRFEPNGKMAIILSAITAGNISSNPLRWESREKAIFILPGGMSFNPGLDQDGFLSQIQLDIGQVISATPRLIYPDNEWTKTYNNQTPEISKNELIIEYTAHPEASFHLSNGIRLPVSGLKKRSTNSILFSIGPAKKRVKIRVVEKKSKKTVAVKLHLHGMYGEYLAPEDRHRLPYNIRFEDFGADFVNKGIHKCTYIPGETKIKLPLGKVYIEISKGFEIKPIRQIVSITPATDEITFTIEKLLPWREKGWVTADTHVHFLSPQTALLEGKAEGVNIIHLLASQWGELVTNVGDFDGKTTLGSKESGGSGEYLVRVGTENRQHVLGHISLLGYEGNIITPMTTGGPDESALGDPVEVLLSQWAKQCKKQNGVVVIPHFPRPRLENAATIVAGDADAVEMVSWDIYSGINPYSLADWYRYLNCGYFVAAVGGTDKMKATVAVGMVRTYAKLAEGREFTHDEWKDSVRKGHTFVSFGPLLDFQVDGKPMGSRINMSRSGGTVDVTWEVASVTVPISRVELVVNGEIRESVAVVQDKRQGHWSFKAYKSCWLALLVRGHYPDKPEIIAAHSSPVMINVEGTRLYAAADAVTILEQIEGTLAYLDTLGTRSDDISYKHMRLILESAHRRVHNQMHKMGYYHNRIPVLDHQEHYR